MIHALGTIFTTSEVKHFVPPLLSSDNKLNKAALLFFAGLTIPAGASLLFVGSAFANFVAMISFVGTGVIFWSIIKSKEDSHSHGITNPSKQGIINPNKHRKNAITMTLKEILNVYGWEEMFKQELLPLDVFKAKFDVHIQNLNAKDAIAFYEQAKEMMRLYSKKWVDLETKRIKTAFEEKVEEIQKPRIFKRLITPWEKFFRYSYGPDHLSLLFKNTEKEWDEAHKEYIDTVIKEATEFEQTIENKLTLITLGKREFKYWQGELHILKMHPELDWNDIYRFKILDDNKWLASCYSSCHEVKELFNAQEIFRKSIEAAYNFRKHKIDLATENFRKHLPKDE